MFDDMLTVVYTASTWLVPVMIAIPFHEVAHGMVANWMGDPTARLRGRLSLNPIRHVDPFGTIILPLILALATPFVFGWAKPVPVDPRYFKNPRRQMIWVALAGPGINFVLAFVGVLSLHLVVLMEGSYSGAWLLDTVVHFIMINLVLGVFNLIPSPPLDGSRVLTGLLPLSLARPYAALEKKGMLILIGILFILPFLGQQVGVDLDILGKVVGVPVSVAAQWLVTFFGP
jgi:Zn-dependent protease